ncbi:BHLHB8 [Mytilus coruscus]|uniref:BHLHB8 n=1 Tax=Mytilus coruscus TaxID=42192 RepID=A0A6J8ANA9_MYTCO|nr:BHLHB8 [Mytilus coruscus]
MESSNQKAAKFEGDTQCFEENCMYAEKDKENVHQITTRKRPTKSKCLEEDRLKTNERERQRMHQMNKGMEELKQVLPYSKSVNKLSKMSTLLLAREHIVSLQKTQKELHHLVQKLHNNLSRQSHNVPVMCMSTERASHSVFNRGLHIYKDYQINTQMRENFMEEKNRKKLQDITNTKRQGDVRPKIPYKFSIDALLSDY